jgi:hypothetical protein
METMPAPLSLPPAIRMQSAVTGRAAEQRDEIAAF